MKRPETSKIIFIAAPLFSWNFPFSIFHSSYIMLQAPGSYFYWNLRAPLEELLSSLVSCITHSIIVLHFLSYPFIIISYICIIVLLCSTYFWSMGKNTGDDKSTTICFTEQWTSRVSIAWSNFPCIIWASSTDYIWSEQTVSWIFQFRIEKGARKTPISSFSPTSHPAPCPKFKQGLGCVAIWQTYVSYLWKDWTFKVKVMCSTFFRITRDTYMWSCGARHPKRYWSISLWTPACSLQFITRNRRVSPHLRTRAFEYDPPNKSFLQPPRMSPFGILFEESFHNNVLLPLTGDKKQKERQLSWS